MWQSAELVMYRGALEARRRGVGPSPPSALRRAMPSATNSRSTSSMQTSPAPRRPTLPHSRSVPQQASPWRPPSRPIPLPSPLSSQNRASPWPCDRKARDTAAFALLPPKRHFARVYRGARYSSAIAVSVSSANLGISRRRYRGNRERRYAAAFTASVASVAGTAVNVALAATEAQDIAAFGVTLSYRYDHCRRLVEP